MAYILISILIGGSISIMISINGELSSLAGQIAALTVIYVVGLSTSSLIQPITKKVNPGGGRRPPFYYFITGSLGLIIVSLNNATFSIGGVVLVLSGMLAGQSLVAFLSDLFRNEKPGRRTIITDLISLLLIASGVAAVGFAYRIPLSGILLSWIPGMILMLQILMNASLASYYGDMRTLQINYASGLAVILIIALTRGVFEASLWGTLSAIPLPFLLGGGMLGVLNMGAQNLLVRKMSALVLVLGTYAGEFSMGIIIDAFLGKKFSLIHAAGLTLVLGGLALRTVANSSTVDS